MSNGSDRAFLHFLTTIGLSLSIPIDLLSINLSISRQRASSVIILESTAISFDKLTEISIERLRQMESTNLHQNHKWAQLFCNSSVFYFWFISIEFLVRFSSSLRDCSRIRLRETLFKFFHWDLFDRYKKCWEIFKMTYYRWLK